MAGYKNRLLATNGRAIFVFEFAATTLCEGLPHGYLTITWAGANKRFALARIETLSLKTISLEGQGLDARPKAHLLKEEKET